MRWPWRRTTRVVSREEALGAYLLFMEGRGGTTFTFPPGHYSQDQIVRDVCAILEAETADLAAQPYPSRVDSFQQRRAHYARQLSNNMRTRA